MTGVVLRPRRQEPAPPPGDRRHAVLVGFQDQGNLGMGYLGAVLEEHGFSVDLVEFRDGPEAITAHVLAAQPLVVGFSLIFQYFLVDYIGLAEHLRRAGVGAHFTIGGHFPSLCPDEVLEAMPQLDSVTLFEGEMTLLELTACLDSGQDWRQVAGLIVRDGAATFPTPPRALVHDLDTLPYPLRPTAPGQVLGWRYVPLLASRGCARRCSFCSIHMFYRTAPGKVVRTRAPQCVAAEARHLVDDLGASILLFQDDDFPLWGRAGPAWVRAMVDAFASADLEGRMIWKISCRAEYVEPELFGELRDAGLYLVYMGLESGSEAGLEVLHKQIEAEVNLQAVETLKALGIPFAYGFMLFDPSTTFDSIHENVAFLRRIVGDGSAAAVFCRMLPYGGTPIREQLRAEGRLRGDITHPDYAFLDPRLDDYHAELDAAVGAWVHGHGVSHQLDWAWHELQVAERLVGPLDGMDGYRQALAGLTAASNNALFDYVERTALAFEQGDTECFEAEVVGRTCDAFIASLLGLRNDFVSRNQDTLLSALEARDRLRGPILLPQIF